MKHIFFKSLLASSILLAVGCNSTATMVDPFPNNQETGADILTPVTITASSHDGNVPEQLFDQDIMTRWSANGDGEWAMLDYGSVYEFDAIQASFSKGNERVSKFDVQFSTDGENWVTVIEGAQSSGRALGLERFQFEPAVKARYVRYVGHGNSKNQWNSVTELAAVNCGINACPASHIITDDVVNAEAAMIAQMKAEQKAQKDLLKKNRKGDFGAPIVRPCETTVTCDLSKAMPYPTLPKEPLATNAPGENFDLTRWKLTTPFDHDKDGRADDIDEWDLANGFQHSDIFYTADDGGMVFKSYVKGARTSENTKYARTELRTMLRAGDKSYSTKGVNPNNWVFSSAPVEDQKEAGGVDGTLEATLKIDHATTTGQSHEVGRFIIGQIHDKDDEPIRLYYRKLPDQPTGTVYFAHEKTKTGTEDYYSLVGDMTGEVGDDGIALGEKFSYIIDVKGNTMTVTVKRDGKDDVVQVVDMSDSGYDEGGRYMYFKAGVYNQNMYGNPDDYAQATFYKLKQSFGKYQG
ncbi:polysaccharide lyase family 7 protein [Vibrio alginolyticus]|uniref:polysaccharide lyase family 7 protein n=1 Tax=Vibrio alginolyticus TaxID=663 RepID=UPI0006CA9A7D|nr:polysaccharide lyase family 7 protein [Vibrio alginolyticus]KPM87884.1 alginate lyase [Vibrio alginolyticus]KPM97339.1 alginate lyase [Vibrio alginolyticus]MCR9506102.1 polysaccharide lyase family 7 protein [Vibrio alginolyticus]